MVSFVLGGHECEGARLPGTSRSAFYIRDIDATGEWCNLGRVVDVEWKGTLEPLWHCSGDVSPNKGCLWLTVPC